MINHLPRERLPGESRIRDIILHVGTNDVSRGRGINNTISDIETYLTKLIDLLSKMYPQARIIYICILPRMDNDHSRTVQVNTVSHLRECKVGTPLWGVSSRLSSSLYFPMRNSEEMTIGKTHYSLYGWLG